ncbi:hypothetical protein [Kamptonema sp. UHCC 0994]|uniref:hypothetical protein n=1 Tax=Kamptonema sp. UHCC 0994 TaxID=3031329 RepID=UPI0023B99220|nr:hypothetical protein [Kamptonema sp. UHCC 0994]MDF0555480.1 hypothetical protein [Kamptonema sp. UHCC 0994]
MSTYLVFEYEQQKKVKYANFYGFISQLLLVAFASLGHPVRKVKTPHGKKQTAVSGDRAAPQKSLCRTKLPIRSQLTSDN